MTMISRNMYFKEKEYLNRFLLMLNEEETSRLFSVKILLFGVGGVGSALVNFLVRSGIENIDIVDFDDIDVTNINRQLVANQTNIGKKKVDEMHRQMLNINPNLKMSVFPVKYASDTADQFDFNNYDIIVDCIDDINAKKLIIQRAKQANKYILSACGAGNRRDFAPEFKVVDIQKTSYDPIAKILRKFCKEQRINHLDVCFTLNKPIKNDCKTVASVVYYPVNMATIMCSKIIDKIIRGEF